MTIALLVVTVVAVGAAVVLARGRSQSAADLAAARSERDELAARLARAEATVTTQAADIDALTQARDAVVADWEAMVTERRGLTDQLDAERRARATAEAGAAPRGDADGRWMLLLAHVARRWAAVVGAPPHDRDVKLGSVATQFTEGLGREIERVREEVGVSVELVVSDPSEPADPVGSLLAVLDLLDVLVAGSERVEVTVGDRVELRSEGWSGTADELEAARVRALAAGVAVDEATTGDEVANVVVSLADDAEPAAGHDDAAQTTSRS